VDNHMTGLSDDGCAYGRAAGTPDKELTEIGPGKACGEFLRRYWHAIAVSAKIVGRPQKIRILGEDLVIFRDGKGRVGLITPRCAHRGASLYYGKVDDSGIRCCYHGWQFDVEGRCLDQPCEPQGGLHKNRVRQPWYPVQEMYGLVWAYMGPAAKRPILPRWRILENLDPGETIYAHGNTGFGVGADDSVDVIPWNWLQSWENAMDPFHVPMLHARHSAIQYTPEAGNMPNVTFQYTDLGTCYIAHRKTRDGREVNRVTMTLLPSVSLIPDQQLERTGTIGMLRCRVPVDDESHLVFYALRVPKGVDGHEHFMTMSRPMPMGGTTMWSEMTEDEHQRFPSDWEAQVSQGPITLHSDEHLVTSDNGVVLLRRLIRQQIRVVQEGGDPIGVNFDPAKAIIEVGSGNYIADTKELA
jgi:phenylpropionate dioxygenase-like ring-hydroxylating dioxygenase large terminal subunit